MKNGYKLKWSLQARNDLKNVINFINDNWSEKEVREFAKKLHKRISLIKTYPSLFPKSLHKQNVRRSVLTKQITIFYSKLNDTINIISVFDVRQDPKKIIIK
ncbi:MAG TPA: type II toxin-antitoxin system RelE/ParE family toxin [Ignavibacteriaceae bacterium]|nr:type II toxin-antitoxin system RelE/ParE family toxin [Ignavibacterium sp.]HRN28059.1 type II toxin-antitoxin system RelE/ParE family toxin [Ignavibacteriaceae bacterium]HRP91301.1 type II toxin-antitoxin system RelE/ParE family toxin [Ignavibacteriaceae bacterium]HRQ55758.1 type II toxin-antitoxin system RelE/ParE family toxin [Ignavibacteriaceae bacterium]